MRLARTMQDLTNLPYTRPDVLIVQKLHHGYVLAHGTAASFGGNTLTLSQYVELSMSDDPIPGEDCETAQTLLAELKASPATRRPSKSYNTSGVIIGHKSTRIFVA